MENRAANGESGVARDARPVRTRKMTVSAALKWAWGDELPKEAVAIGMMAAAPNGSKSAWSAVTAYGEAGTIVDRQPNRWGCIPFDMADWPHPDAITIANAVAALCGCTLEVPEGWHPMPEIAPNGLAGADHDLGDRALRDALDRIALPDSDGNLQFRSAPDMLVVRHAILGIVPDWRLAAAPVKRFEVNANGQPKWFVQRPVSSVIGTMPDGSDRIAVTNTEVDGWSPRLRRPVAGAYRKAYLDPDPVPVIVARAEYEIFRMAMAMLESDLSGQLETVDIMPEDWPAQPWEQWADDSPGMSAARRGPRILPDLRAMIATAAPPANARKSGKRRRCGKAKITA